MLEIENFFDKDQWIIKTWGTEWTTIEFYHEGKRQRENCIVFLSDNSFYYYGKNPEIMNFLDKLKSNNHFQLKTNFPNKFIQAQNLIFHQSKRSIESFKNILEKLQPPPIFIPSDMPRMM